MKYSDACKDIDYLLTPKEVRPLLKVSLPTVYNLVDRGQLPAVIWDAPNSVGKKKQRTIRIKRSDVFDFIERNYQKRE